MISSRQHRDLGAGVPHEDYVRGTCLNAYAMGFLAAGVVALTNTATRRLSPVPLRGQREALPAEAVGHEDRLLALRQRVQQRPAVRLEGRHLLAAPGHVQRCNAVGGGHPVPGPRAVADTVDQDEVVLLLLGARTHGQTRKPE
jgi:hypothetical protein